MHYCQRGRCLILWISQHHGQLLRPVPAACCDVPLPVGLLLLGRRRRHEQVPEAEDIDHRIHAYIGRVGPLHAPRPRNTTPDARRRRRARAALQAAEHHAAGRAHARALRRHRGPGRTRTRGPARPPRPRARARVPVGVRGGRRGRGRGRGAGQEREHARRRWLLPLQTNLRVRCGGSADVVAGRSCPGHEVEEVRHGCRPRPQRGTRRRRRRAARVLARVD